MIGLRLVALATFAATAQAQETPTQALALGLSPSAGVLGVEWLQQSFRVAPRFGGGVGVGVLGFGGRLNFGLRNPIEHRWIPYLAASHTETPWFPGRLINSVSTLGGGVQRWPSRAGWAYFELGLAFASLRGGLATTGVMLRLLVGPVF